jgi:D-lyxose ketol-isomerase
MKRSEINHYIDDAKQFLDKHQFKLPPFAYWSPQDWKSKGHEADQIRQCLLGWDVTSFGSPDFLKMGLLLFTVRNGKLGDPANQKIYAEKIMVVREAQVTPYHFHHQKAEDIINRGGGKLECILYNANAQDGFADTPVQVWCDGVERVVAAGGKVVLEPGESITLTPRMYHSFYAQKGHGTALIGEVSSVNDDSSDNRFHEPLARFPAIEEDVPARHLLGNEYPKARQDC